MARRSAALGLVLALAPVLVLVADAASEGRPEPTRRAARLAATSALLYAALLAAALHAAVPYLDASRADLRTPFATARLRGVRSSALRVAGVDGVVGLVRQETRPGQYVLAFPDFPALYFLAERPNPTRVDWFLPEELTGAEVRQVLTDLQRRPPRLVVVTALNPRQMRENRRLRPVLAHLLARYEEWVSIGEFLVFRPRGRAPDGSAGAGASRRSPGDGGPPRPRLLEPGRGPGQEV